MLHIVNGDSVAGRLREGVVDGHILVWREVYPEGPNFVDDDVAANRSARAQYLQQFMGVPAEEYMDGCERQAKELASFEQYDTVVLWFEHDLFDQTMLCYLLHWFSKQSGDLGTLNLLCVGSYPGVEDFRGLGQLTASQLMALKGTWQPITEEQFALGAKVWEAYASPDPLQLVALLREANTSALPYMRDAMELHLARFPSTYNGLGIVEQTTLELVSSGVSAPWELFRQTGDKLHLLGMGDLQYWGCLQRMAQGPHPLLHIEGLETTFPTYSEPSPVFAQSKIHLTKLGRAVLEGREDWVHMQDTEAWLGGVYLGGTSARWRWDVVGKTVVG